MGLLLRLAGDPVRGGLSVPRPISDGPDIGSSVSLDLSSLDVCPTQRPSWCFQGPQRLDTGSLGHTSLVDGGPSGCQLRPVARVVGICNQ